MYNPGLYTKNDKLLGRFKNRQEFEKLLESYFIKKKIKPIFIKYSEYNVNKYKLRHWIKIEFGDIYNYLFVKMNYNNLLRRLVCNEKQKK